MSKVEKIIFFGGLLVILGILIAALFCSSIEHPELPIKKEIKSLLLDNRQSISGGIGFVLGIGGGSLSQNSFEYYYFYEKEKNGGLRLVRKNRLDVLIFLDEENNPYVVYPEGGDKECCDRAELHIPANSIMERYNIDLSIPNKE